MRFINVQTYKLDEFHDAEAPYYAVLSHMWVTEEVSYQEALRLDIRDLPKFRKIANA